MMWTIWLIIYFIDSICNELLLWNPDKYYTHPSIFLYCLRYIIPECVGIYYLYKYLVYLLWIPLQYVVLSIIMILAIDIIYALKCSIWNDF